ncbi:MAG: TRAP transporter small permease [Verrucomicrobiales bacterium]
MWANTKQITARALGWLAIVVFLILTLDVLLGVFSRKILGDQIRWTEELARFLLVWVSFLGGAIAYIDEKHLGVDLLVERLHPQARKLSRLLVHLLVFAFSLFVMGVGGTKLVIDRFDAGQLLPALQIDKAWFYLGVPISGYLIALFALGNVIALLARKEDGGIRDDQEQEVAP